MAAKNQTGLGLPLTKFAQKYGVYKQRSKVAQEILQGYKSGHTPVSPSRADESLGRKRWKDEIKKHQLKTTGGFPIEWARALRAYVPTASTDFASDWEKAELHNPIHPLFEQSEWETLDGCLMNFPPPLFSNGFMVAENEIVWEALKPVLQLTTQYLLNAHLWPWWDALLSEANSDNKIIEQSPHVSSEQNLFFWMRTPEEVSKQALQVKELFMEMKGHWLFHFRSMFSNSTRGGPTSIEWTGVTTMYGGPGKGSICIGSELMEALVRTDLTEAERVMMVTFGARNLAHEIAHAAAVHHHKRCDPRRSAKSATLFREAYFQDEALNELGHSMEQNVFKANDSLQMTNTQGLALVVHSVDFPFPGIHGGDDTDKGHCQYLPKGIDKEPHSHFISLVPIERMRMLLFPDFWDHYIYRFGGDVLTPDAPQAQRFITCNSGTKDDYLPEYRDVFIEPNFSPTPDMSHGDIIALEFANRRRNMQREARDRLEEVLGASGYTRDPDTGLLKPPSGEEPSEQAPSGTEAPGVPQAQETEQIQGEPQGQGQPPAPLPQVQEVPAPPERAPTPEHTYMLPDDRFKLLTKEEGESALEIRDYVRYFRNRLGLHCIATCSEDALWFHLAHLVDTHYGEVVTREDWGYFLRACNAAEMLLSYNPESTLVYALRTGWESDAPPLPFEVYPQEDFGSQENLQRALDLVRKYTFRCAHLDFKEKWYDSRNNEHLCDEVTWRDLRQLTYDFSIDREVNDIDPEHFRYICLTYLSTCWTTGPKGCIQYNAPHFLYNMLHQLDQYAIGICETTDVGAVIPTNTARDIINTAFEGIDVPPELRPEHPRHFLRENENWWKQVIIELLPEYFSIVMHEGKEFILFTFARMFERERLLDLMTEAQTVALYAFTEKYWIDPGARREIWPAELREIYNEAQQDRRLRIYQPRVFFSSFLLPSNYCHVLKDNRIGFYTPTREQREAANARAKNAGGGAQGGAYSQGPSGIPILTQPNNQEGWVQEGQQQQGGAQLQEGAYAQGPSGIPILTQPPDQGGWGQGVQQQQQGNEGQQGNQWQQRNEGQQGNQWQQGNQGEQGNQGQQGM
ncbi:hypothetical protein VE03_01844 [Pseudogymnoascus sp. 23342-1-I1]|nr:hypothetical protein VE03_01844 [Pseudogymnoascus sp. 23342-1-I1]